jgi:hypothetical protein
MVPLKNVKYIMDLLPWSSVADLDPGSGAFLTPRSGIRKPIQDPGSQTHIFESLATIFDNFLGKKFYHSLKNFFFSISKIK